jgi:AraC family transcriptional regulator
MAEARHPGNPPERILRGGEFYSPVRSHLRIGGALISELNQPCARNMPQHEHELAYVSVVLEGDYLEGNHGNLVELPPMSAVFNPSGVSHTSEIGPRGTSMFTVEFRSHALRDFDLRLPEQIIFDRGEGSIFWAGLRLYSAFKAQTNDSSQLEAHVLEVLGAITGFRCAEKAFPRWFGLVKERIHDEFRLSLRVKDLANLAGIHPVHLARVFRQFEHCTPGEYQRKLQVRAACGLLRDLQWPLAVIAAECGFADQSHFTRVFRRRIGTTPAHFRRMFSAHPFPGDS